MCRYSQHPSRTSFVCLPCRHVAQYYVWSRSDPPPRCPHCREVLWAAGRDFKAPRKRNNNGWRAVEAVKDSGRNYDSCGCGGPGWRPSTIAEVRREATERRWIPRGRKDRSFL